MHPMQSSITEKQLNTRREILITTILFDSVCIYVLFGRVKENTIILWMETSMRAI